MATINELLNKINEFKSRVGRFSIGKSDFFGFMTDVVNKQKELADRQAADLLGSVDLSGTPATYPALVLGWWKIKTNVTSVDGGDLNGVEVKAGGQLVCDGVAFSYVEDPDLVQLQGSLNSLADEALLRVQILHPVTQMGSGISRSEGFAFIIDARLTGFDTSGKYYGLSIINKDTKVVILYEVNEFGTYIDGNDPGRFALTVVETNHNITRLQGSGGHGSAEVLVDWSRISDGEHGAIPSFRFADEVYSDHYGALKEWSDLKSIVTDVDYLKTEKDASDPILLNKIDKKPSLNLLNPEEFRFNEFFFAGSTSVATGSGNMYGLSGFIKAKEAGLISINTGKSASGLSSHVVYDENKTPLRTVSNTDQYTYQSGDGFVVFCYLTGGDLDYIKSRAIIEGTVYSFDKYTEYKPLADLEERVSALDGGSSEKADLNLLSPKKIYTVLNDLDSNLTEARSYSAALYLDHMMKGITSEPTANFELSGTERQMIYSPEHVENVKSYDKTFQIKGGGSFNDASITIKQKSTKESVGKSATVKVLSVGDSVTNGYLANVGVPEGNPHQFWSVILEQFEKARIDGGNNASEYNCVSLGHWNSNHWELNYKGVTKSMSAYCEGYGGWKSSTHMFHTDNRGQYGSGVTVEGQGIFDLLGLGDGSGSDYTGSIEQIELINRTPEGKFAPKNTAALVTFMSEIYPGDGIVDYTTALAKANDLLDNPVNPFFDKDKVGDVKFSMLKWLDRYKTLDDSGLVRLDAGTKGSKVSDVNDYDVCLPSHIILQHSHNDGNVDWINTNYREWTNSIKVEYAANGWGDVHIGLSIIDHTGSYYPSRYPEFDTECSLWNHEGGHAKAYDNFNRLKAEYWVDDANEDVEKIYLLPSMFIQPTAWATPWRTINSPEFDYSAQVKHKYLTEYGGGPDWHPNGLCHRAWGIQMYAWIKYTLS